MRDGPCLGDRVLRVLEPPDLSHHHDDVVGRVLSSCVRHSQSDVSSVESSGRPHYDLIVSCVVEAEIELRPSPRHNDEVAKQRVRHRSNGADSHEHRRPSVDSSAEKGTEIT